MKLLIAALIFGVVAGGTSACVPVAGTTQKISTEVRLLKADQEIILTTILRERLKYRTPEDDVKLFYVSVIGNGRPDFEQFKGKSYRLNTGTGYRMTNGVHRDRESGQRCWFLTLKIESIEGDAAVAFVAVDLSYWASETTIYDLRKVYGEWQVEKQTVVAGA